MLAMELPQSWNEPLILLLNIYILDIEGYLNFVSVMKICLSAIINAVAADVLWTQEARASAALLWIEKFLKLISWHTSSHFWVTSKFDWWHKMISYIYFVCPWGWFSIKMPPYQYRNFYYKDHLIFIMEIPYLERWSLYWNRALIACCNSQTYY